MSRLIDLTFTQCKQIRANCEQYGYDWRDVIERLQDQPDFMSNGFGVDSIDEIRAIIQCGTAGNAHKSVFYYEASKQMHEYGDEVLEYIDYQLGELPQFDNDTSWHQLASFYLSCAVELWCSQFEQYLEDVDWD